MTLYTAPQGGGSARGSSLPAYNNANSKSASQRIEQYLVLYSRAQHRSDMGGSPTWVQWAVSNVMGGVNRQIVVGIKMLCVTANSGPEYRRIAARREHAQADTTRTTIVSINCFQMFCFCVVIVLKVYCLLWTNRDNKSSWWGEFKEAKGERRSRAKNKEFGRTRHGIEEILGA